VAVALAVSGATVAPVLAGTADIADMAGMAAVGTLGGGAAGLVVQPLTAQARTSGVRIEGRSVKRGRGKGMVPIVSRR